MAEISKTSRAAVLPAPAAAAEGRRPSGELVVLARGGQAQRLELQVARQIPLLRQALTLPSGAAPLATGFDGTGLAYLRRYLGGDGPPLPPPTDVAGRAALAEAARFGGLDELFLELEIYEPQRAAALQAQQAGDAPAAAALLRALATRMLADVVVDEDGQRRPANAEGAARRELDRAASLAPAPGAEAPYFRAWCHRAPRLAAAWAGLATALAAAGEPAACAAAARRGMDLASDDDNYRRARTLALEALAHQRLWDDVAALVNDAVTHGRDDDDMYRELAALCDHGELQAEALDALDVLRRRGTLSGNDMMLRGDLLWEVADADEALACYRAALAAEPPPTVGAERWADVGNHFYDRFDYEAAAAACDRALALSGGACASTLATRGWAQWHQAALPEAANDAGAALAHDPDNVSALRLLIRAAPEGTAAAAALRRLAETARATADEWYALAEVELAQGNLDAALAAVNTALHEAPASAHGWMLMLRGTVQRRLQDEAAAVDDLRRAAALLQDDEDGLVELGNRHMDAQQWDEAFVVLRRTVVLAPERVDVQLSLASALFNLGDLEVAQRQLEGLLAAHPGHARALRWLAMVLDVRGFAAEATQVAEAAERAAPHDPKGAEGLAALLARRQMWAEADAAYGRALAAGSGTAAAAREGLFGGANVARLVAQRRVFAFMRRPEVVNGVLRRSADGAHVLFGRAELPHRPGAGEAGRFGRACGEIWRAYPARSVAYAGLNVGLTLWRYGFLVDPLWGLLGLTLQEGAVPELSRLDVGGLTDRRTKEEETARLWAWLAQSRGRVGRATDAELGVMEATVAALAEEMDWFVEGTRARTENLAWAVQQARRQRAAAGAPGAAADAAA